MNFSKLFAMQKELDAHIEENHQLHNENLVDRKILALYVEIGELANETRCFKFWSKKPPADKSVILEEFVDGIHFILSLGLECGYEHYQSAHLEGEQASLTEQFNNVYQNISTFKAERNYMNYERLFHSYIWLGERLGFKQDEVEHAYFQKNEVNYERQQQGY